MKRAIWTLHLRRTHVPWSLLGTSYTNLAFEKDPRSSKLAWHCYTRIRFHLTLVVVCISLNPCSLLGEFNFFLIYRELHLYHIFQIWKRHANAINVNLLCICVCEFYLNQVVQVVTPFTYLIHEWHGWHTSNLSVFFTYLENGSGGVNPHLSRVVQVACVVWWSNSWSATYLAKGASGVALIVVQISMTFMIQFSLILEQLQVAWQHFYSMVHLVNSSIFQSA